MKMRLLIVSVVLVLGLVACGQDAPVTLDPAVDVVTDAPVEGTVSRATIDQMPCLVWQNKKSGGSTAYAYSGLTCDWSKR